MKNINFINDIVGYKNIQDLLTHYGYKNLTYLKNYDKIKM